jgi:nitric oxide reductase NorQ protein
MGIIPQSMSSGGILYLDELNAAEPDVLIRLDEALDDRRELVLKEAGEIVTIKAREDWFVIATINPLSHAGTKELPPQLLSRFPIRLYLDYPPLDIEKRIVRMYVDGVDDMVLDNGIKLAQKLREAAKVQDVYYSPSIRETIAYAKLVKSGVEPKKAAELIFANAYWQWGETETKKVQDLIVSIFGGQS